jgi:hypothetical protein
MAQRRGVKVMSWREALSDESLARMALEAVINTEGQTAGHRVVWPGPDKRAKGVEVRFQTPALHVAASTIHLHGAVFALNTEEGKRECTVRTTREFSRCPDWIEAHPLVAEENREFYERAEAFRARAAELCMRLPSQLASVTALGVELLLKSHKSKVSASILNSDRADAKAWMEKYKKTPAAAKARALKTVAARMVADSDFCAAPEFSSDLVEKFLESSFKSWHFLGRTTDEGETIEGDADPLGVLRFKMRPFVKAFAPKGGSRASLGAAAPLDYSGVVDVSMPAWVYKGAGLGSPNEIFEVEARLKGQGYALRRPCFQGKFPKDLEMRKLPDGSVVPFHADPREWFLRPGSVAMFTLSPFLWRVQSESGVKFTFDPHILVIRRGPPIGAAEVRYEDPDDLAEDLDGRADRIAGGEPGEPPDAQGRKRRREADLPELQRAGGFDDEVDGSADAASGDEDAGEDLY